MELSFIVSALRRYFWVVILFAALGAVPGLLRPGDQGGLFRSTAVLLVSPSTESRVQSSSGDADRYIAGQLSVLGSESLAGQVAEQLTSELGEEYTAAGVRAVVDFTNEARTDIVNISAATPDPALSQAIGNAYVGEYFEALRTQVDEAQEPEIDQLDQRTESLRSALDDADRRLQEAMAPYLPAGPIPEGEAAPAIPSVEQVAPGLVSERQLLLSELETASAALAELETSARLRVGSEVVQRATLPTEPEPTPTNRLLIVGVVCGAFAGALVAVVLARLSPRVLDDSQATDILGQPIVGALPVVRSLARNRRLAVEQLPANVIPFINALCVRAQVDHGGGSLSILVAGARGGVGSTTLAGAVANRMAAMDASVLLVDADSRHPELTMLFGAHRPIGLAPSDEPESDELDAQRAQGANSIKPTAIPNLKVASVGSATLRRVESVTELFERLESWADVTVYDGGSLLASASTVQLSRLCDTVIIAVPRRQTIRGLNAVARTLRHRDFLPVWTSVGRRRRAGRRRADADSGQDAELIPDELVATSP